MTSLDPISQAQADIAAMGATTAQRRALHRLGVTRWQIKKLAKTKAMAAKLIDIELKKHSILRNQIQQI